MSGVDYMQAQAAQGMTQFGRSSPKPATDAAALLGQLKERRDSIERTLSDVPRLEKEPVQLKAMIDAGQTEVKP